MAGNLFQLPTVISTDPVNGVPGAGNKLYFYENGTTTPKDTYTDSSLGTPHSNPVVADSGGYFAEIFLDGVYSWKLTDSDDVEIDSGDDYEGFANADTGNSSDNVPTNSDLAQQLIDPIHATDSGTDTFVSASGSTPATGAVTARDFQSANTTTTPTLDSITIKTRDGSALWAGAIDGTHLLYYDGTDYLLLDPDFVTVQASDLDNTTGEDDNFVSGTAGSDGQAGVFNSDGDLVGGTAPLPDTEGVVDATNGGADDLTEIDFTGLASGAERITVMLDSISLSGTDEILVQIGDSGGFETSGYNSASTAQSSGGNIVSSTSGFIHRSSTASRAYSGFIILERISGNKWIARHNSTRVSDNGTVVLGGGDKELSAELDRVRITTTGTDTFDNGEINVRVEI